MITARENPPKPIILERPFEAATAVRFAPQTNPVDSAQFREDFLRRYHAPYPFPWRHGGLNE
jgi:hypothetical protein